MDEQNAPTNRLTNLSAFESVLAHYRPSQPSIALFRSVKLVMLVGPTAAGRNTLISILTATGRYKMIVSDTTRHPRTNNGVLEQDGSEYWFKTETDFLAGLKEGHYLEAAIIHQQQVSGAHIREFEAVKDAGVIALKEIEPHGADLYYQMNPAILAIFLLPPSFPIWMERLRGRDDMPEPELIRRLQSAKSELHYALSEDIYQFVVNNEIHEAADAVDQLAIGRAPNPQKQAYGRQHAATLIAAVTDYLDNLS
jgi:guanylate kinase